MLNYQVERLNNIIILHINGILYMNNIQYAESVWNNQILKDPKIIAINCKNLTHVDSTAIGTLVKFFNNAMSNKIQLVFYDLNNAIMKLFKTAKLNKYFSITSKNNFESLYMPNNS